MAEIIEENNNGLQEKIDALNEQIQHLEQVIEKNAESAQNISEQIARNKDEEKAIFSKYEDTIQKVFGENHKKSANAERIGDLTDIAKSISKDIKANAGKTSTSELEAQLKEVRQDIERVRAIRSETRQLNSEKKSADNTINESNNELTRFREALRSITVSNNNHLASIDKTNQGIDQSSESIDAKLDELINISSKLDRIYEAIPPKTEESIPDDDDDTDDTDDERDDEFLENNEEELEILKEEEETVDGIKQLFTDLVDVIDEKNESLEDENALLEEEEEKLEGAVSKFKEMHDEAEGINDTFEEGQKTLTKASSISPSSKSSSKWGALASIFETMYDLTLGFNDKWNEIDDHAHKYGRTLGMSVQQMRSYQKMLMSTDMTNLMGKYHMLGSEINALQSGFTEASNSAKILAINELDAMAATTKYVGSDTAMAIASSMRELGGSLVDSQSYLATTMARAKASGLNMVKHSKNFADNIKLASKYNFKQGLSDISKMTALTDRWQVNLGAFAEGLSSSFNSIEDSIQSAAKLQVLGGPMAAAFGNPLEMMNMAKTDMAGLIERFKDSIKDAGKFNKETGIVDINSFQKDILKAQAEALHLNYDEVLKAVNSEEKSRAIAEQTRLKGLDNAQTEWLSNMAEYDAVAQKWYVTTLDKEGHAKRTNVEDINSLKQLDLLRDSANTEEALRGDVHAIRMKLLGDQQTKSSLNATSSYNEHKQALRDRWQTIGAGAIDELEQLKLDVIYKIEDGVNKVIQGIDAMKLFFKGAAETWNGWMAKIGGFAEKYLTFGDTQKAGNVAAGVTFLAATSAVLVGINKIKKLFTKSSAKGAAAEGAEKAATTSAAKTATTSAAKTATKSGARGAAKSAEQKALAKAAEHQNEAVMARKAAELRNGRSVIHSTEQVTTHTTEEVIEQGATQTLKKGAVETSEKATSQVVKGGLKRTATRGALKTLGKTGTKALVRGLGSGAMAAVIEVPWAMWDNYQRNQEYKEEKAYIEDSYGSFDKNNLTQRMDDGGSSFYLEAEKALSLKKAELRKDNDNTARWSQAGGAIAGAAAGAAIGSVVPIIGTFVGGLIGGIIGGYGGQTIGERVTATNVTDEEVFGKDELAQRYFETTKIGFANVKTKEDLFEQAAIATIGIHDLLISQDNETHGKKWNGDTEEEFEAKKEKIEAKKEAEYKASHPFKWYNPFTWFAQGGVVHASTGLQSVPSFNQVPSALARGNDTVPAMLSPGEMILNSRQQSNLWNIISSSSLFSSPTPILNSNQINGGITNGKLGFEPLNISINGSLKIDTGFGSQGNISGQDLLRNSEFIRQLSNEIQRYMDGMFNGGTFAGEHSRYKLDKV